MASTKTIYKNKYQNDRVQTDYALHRLSKDIYKENQQNKEKFKSNFLKKTNTILNNDYINNEIHTQYTTTSAFSPNNKNFNSRKSCRKNMTSDELFGNKNNNNKAIVYENKNEKNFKNTYETQYTKNKVDFEKKKSFRRQTAKSIDFLTSRNNITGNENKIVDDVTFKNNKKLFESVYYRKSLQNLYRGEAEKHQHLNEINNYNNNYNERPMTEKQEIIHPLKTKKHFVKKKFNFFSYFSKFF